MSRGFKARKKRLDLYRLSLKDREKGTTKAFSSYKLKSTLCLVYLEIKLQQNKHLVISLPENGRSKVFRGKQAPNKVPLLFLDVKLLEETFGLRF